MLIIFAGMRTQTVWLSPNRRGHVPRVGGRELHGCSRAEGSGLSVDPPSRPGRLALSGRVLAAAGDVVSSLRSFLAAYAQGFFFFFFLIDDFTEFHAHLFPQDSTSKARSSSAESAERVQRGGSMGQGMGTGSRVVWALETEGETGGERERQGGRVSLREIVQRCSIAHGT